MSWIFLHQNSQELSMLYSETVWLVAKQSLIKATGLDIFTSSASKKVRMEWGTEWRSYQTYSCIWTECAFLVYKLTSVFRQLVPFTYSGMLHRHKWDRGRGKSFTIVRQISQTRARTVQLAEWAESGEEKKHGLIILLHKKSHFTKNKKKNSCSSDCKKCHSFATSTPSHHTEKDFFCLLYLLCKDQWQFYSICYEQVKTNEGFTQPAMNR